jgi:hypothetical protein
MIPINIYYANTSLERVLEESRQDFPLPGIAINLEREHSAEMQAASAHEIVRIVLDPGQVALLLGMEEVGFPGGVAEVGGKSGELVTGDLYEWIRRLLKRLAEDFIKDFVHIRYRKGIQGIRLDITSSKDAELKCILRLIYSDDSKRFCFDILSACLDIFQIIIRPIIRSLAETAKVRAVIIQGRLGFDSAGSWAFSITTTENLYSFPEIPLKNVIDPETARKTVSDWTKRSNETKKTPMKAVRTSPKSDG